MSFDTYEISPYSGTPERLFLFTLGVDTTWAYNNQHENIVKSSTIYVPAVISMDNIVQNLGEGPPSVEISMAADTPVAQQFVAYQPVKKLKVMVQRRHRDDPAGEYIVELIGEVVSASFDEEESRVTLTCRMVSSNFSRRAPWLIYQKQCNYGVYGPGCWVNPEDFRTDGEVDVVNESLIDATEWATMPDGWFRAGFVRNTRTGETRFILDHVGPQLLLQTPFVDVVLGDILAAYAGDNRSYEMCVGKFDNGHRFAGFEWMPSKNPFTDNVYGNGTPEGPSSEETDWRTAINPAGWDGTWGLI